MTTLAVLGGLGVLVVAGRRRRVLRRGSAAIAAAAHRRGGRLARAVAAVAAVRSQLQGIRLGRAAALSAATLFLVAWLADAACLVCALLALGVTPPWSSLLVAYSAAQLVSFLPVTPGGLGLVEGSLTMTLGARGGTGAIVAGVMLYRGISYWATLPAGLAGYFNLRRTRSRRHPPPAARGAASAPVPGGVALEGAAR